MHKQVVYLRFYMTKNVETLRHIETRNDKQLTDIYIYNNAIKKSLSLNCKMPRKLSPNQEGCGNISRVFKLGELPFFRYNLFPIYYVFI